MKARVRLEPEITRKKKGKEIGVDLGLERGGREEAWYLMSDDSERAGKKG